MLRIGKRSLWFLSVAGAALLFTSLFSTFHFYSNRTVFASEAGGETAVNPSQPAALPHLVATQELTATKRDTLFNDLNNNGGVDEGDTLAYTLVIQSTGVDAVTNAAFADTLDANTTLTQIDGLDFKSTPIASNDSFTSLGNVGIDVPVGSGVLQNDTDPDGSGALTIVSFDSTSANGGDVAISANGAFTYMPPLGFEGDDTFSYTVEDVDGNQDEATVTVTVSEVIWFVDNSAAAGNGRLTTPFNTLAALEALNGNGGATDPEAGDIIFIYETGSGDYTGGLTLENNQIVVGQGISASLNGAAGITLPPHSRALPTTDGNSPTIANPTGSGLTLASNNGLAGFDVGNTPNGVGIRDNGGTVGTLIISEVGIRGTGKAFEVDSSGVVNIVLDEVGVTSSTTGGFELENVTGSTVLSGVNIVTSGGTAVLVNNGGTFAISGATNVVNASGGTAVNITNSTISALGVTFQSISANGGTNGIVLSNTGTSGGFTVTGTGGTVQGGNASGGTVTNTTGDAITISQAMNVSLTNMNIQNPATDGLDISDVVGALTIDQITINNVDNIASHAIIVDNVSGTANAAYTINNSLFSESDTNQPLVLFEFQGALGTTAVNVQDSLWSQNDPVSFELLAYGGAGSPTSGNLVHTFTGNTIQNVDTDGAGETNHFCAQSATCTFTVSDNTYQNLGKGGGGNIGMINIGTSNETMTPSAGLLKMTISDNELSNLDGASNGSRRGIYVVNRHSGSMNDVEIILDNNTIDSLGNREALYVLNQGDISTIDLFMRNNLFGTGVLGPANDIGGTLDGVYIRHIRGTMNATIDNNTIQTDTGNADQIIEVEADNVTSIINATVTNNLFSSSGASTAMFEITNDGNSFCLDIRDNTAVGGANPWFIDNNNAGGTYLVEGAGSGAVTSGQLQSAPHNNVGGFIVQGTINNNNNTNCAVPVVSSVVSADVVVAETAVSSQQPFTYHQLLTPLATLQPTKIEPVTKLAFSGETLNGTLGTMDAGQVVTITFHATVDSNLPNGVSTVCNQASVTADSISIVSDDPDTGATNDSTCTQLSATDVAISKIVTNEAGDSGDSVTVNTGETITYTLTVTNSGPVILSSGAVVTDNLPSGISLVSFTATEGTANSSGDPNLVWTLGNMGIGEVQSATIVATIDSGQGGATLVNETAVSDTNEIESNSANNSDTATVIVRGADVSIDKAVSASTVDVGESVIYTITVENNGPDATSGVVVSDLFPDELTFGGINAISSGTYNSGTGIWTINDASFINGETHTLELVGSAPASAAGDDVVNTAVIIASDAEDGVSSNNSDSATVSVRLIDLNLEKTVSNATPIEGEAVTYSLTVTNFGPDVAENVTISDTIPANMTYVPASISGGTMRSDATAPELSWIIDTLPVNAPVTLQFAATPDGGTTGMTIKNTAEVFTDGIYELNYDNNTDSVSVTVSDVDLALSKTAVQTLETDLSTTITYTLKVSNPGPAGVTNLTVTDNLPAEVSFVSAVGDGSFNNPSDTWTIGTLAANETATLTIVVTTMEPIGEVIVNTAVIATVDQVDLNSSNNSDDAIVTITDKQADLQLTKTASDTTPPQGGQFTYTLVVTNNGPDAATGVVVTDNLPAGIDFISTSAVDGTYDELTGEWTIGALANGASASLTMVVSTDEPVGTMITNEADITAVSQTDPNFANNSDDVTITVNPPITFSYLPLISTPALGADLVVSAFDVTRTSVTIEITNDGDTAVTDDFWVDVYVNPNLVPTGVNQTVQSLGVAGFVWGVEGVTLNPGDSLTLTLNDAYYFASESTAVLPLTLGLPVYVQVDSANLSTTYGAVEESHEKVSGTYNNIVMTSVK